MRLRVNRSQIQGIEVFYDVMIEVMCHLYKYLCCVYEIDLISHETCSSTAQSVAGSNTLHYHQLPLKDVPWRHAVVQLTITGGPVSPI